MLPNRQGVLEATLDHDTALADGECPIRTHLVVGVRVEDRGIEAPTRPVRSGMWTVVVAEDRVVCMFRVVLVGTHVRCKPQLDHGVMEGR